MDARVTFRTLAAAFVVVAASCTKPAPQQAHVKQFDAAAVAAEAKAIEASVTPQIDSGLTLSLWATDSMVADPVSIHVDNLGRLYYTRTNRQKHSEFEIRAHQDWEIGSIAMKSVDDRSAFLKKTLAPENSGNNTWFEDLNHDGSRDWKDLLVEKEQVYRLEDKSGDGVADYSQRVVDDFNTEVSDVAGAIITNGNELYIGVSPDMWRMKDNDGDGVFEDKTSIMHGFGVHIGFGGHGMSGLEMGPDGKLYWQIGDLGFSGKGANGEKYEYSNCGVIVRANPDGSDFEVFAFGNRNTHNFVFDDYGNLITEDNDGDHAGERERLIYVVDGADIGWRINWQFGKYRDDDNNKYKVWMDEKMYLPRFEGQAAYFLPPLANYVSGPTGMLYNPGTALSPEWKNTFFIGEFVGNPAQSGIHAFKLKPNGAAYELEKTKSILKGVLATGIDFGPDGAMYLADWIQGWGTKNFGRVWKLDVPQGQSNLRKETQKLLADDFGKFDDNKLAGLLKHEDKRIRQQAQFTLATRGDSGLKIFKTTLDDRDNQLARIHAIWGISQFARKKSGDAALLLPLLKDADEEIRAQATRWLGDVRYKEAGPALLPLLKDKNARVRFFAAEALGRIAYEPAIDPIVDMLRDNNDADVYLRHAGSLALGRIGKADRVSALHNDPSKAIRIAAVVALRRMKDPGIAAFLADKDEFIVTEAARAINDDLNIAGALPALADLLATTTFTNEPLIRRAINANLEVGTDKAMQNLIGYANKTSNPGAMRAEAIDALGTWSKPSVMDRVDGYYRGAVTRDPEQVKRIGANSLIALITDRSPAIQQQAIKAASKLSITDASPAIVARLKSDKTPQVRVEALKALAALHDPALNDAVKTGLADNDKTVRVVALDLLKNTSLPDKEKVSLLADVVERRTVEEKQAALVTLGSLPAASTAPVLGSLMTQAENNKLPKEIYVEFAETIEESKSAELINRYKAIIRKAGADSLFVQFQGTLSGGNPDRGIAVFYGNENAQCLRCHSFNDYGGTAGPRLNGIGARLPKEKILEALITPSARIAPGFGTVSLQLKDGRKISGILQHEDNKGYVVKSGQKADTLVAKADVEKASLSGSSMPPMNLLLTKKEIRDLIAFLSAQKDQ